MKKRFLTAALSLSLVCIMVLSLGLTASAGSTAPIAENFEFETYRGVSFGGQLAAVDPNGEVLHYEITTKPRKGELKLKEDGSFVYTPAEGKRGRDYFGYKAVSENGKHSQEATMIIKLVKCKSAVRYADMEGRADYRSALRLAECGAFVGKKLGAEYFFEPQVPMTRGEFVAMCLECTGKDILSGVVKTGFADDGDIPDWLKTYAQTAAMQGLVKGDVKDKGVFFDAGKDVTSAEAMVILNRALQLSDVSYVNLNDSIPTWAVQSAANLTACSIVDGSVQPDSVLTRGEAASMLCAAMDLIDKR